MSLRTVWTVLLSSLVLVAPAAARDEGDPRYTWERAQAELNEAGRMLERGQFDQALAQLAQIEEDFPPAYGKIAAAGRKLLEQKLRERRAYLTALKNPPPVAEVKPQDLLDPFGGGPLEPPLPPKPPADPLNAAVRKQICSFPFNYGTELTSAAQRAVQQDLPSEDRAQAYWSMLGQLNRLQDEPGAVAWGKAFLREFPEAWEMREQVLRFLLDRYQPPESFEALFNAYHDTCRHLPMGDDRCTRKLIYRARGRKEAGELGPAMELYHQIIKEYPATYSGGGAHLGLGDCFRELRQYSQAIREYKRVIEMDTDHIPTLREFPAPFEAYEYQAAWALSECYLKIDRPAQAVKWRVAASQYGGFGGSCGLALMSSAIEHRARATLLMFQVSYTERAVQRGLQAILTEPSGDEDWREVCFRTVDHYLKTDQIDVLLSKIAQTRARNLLERLKWDKPQWTERDKQIYDGQSEGMQVALAYLNMRRLADECDLDGLWKIPLEFSGRGHMAIELPETDYWGSHDSWQAPKAIEMLLAAGEPAISCLKRQSKGLTSVGAWAHVILAQQKAANPELIKLQLAEAERRLRSSTNDDERDDLTRLQIDLYYALYLVDPEQTKERMILAAARQRSPEINVAADALEKIRYLEWEASLK